MPGTSTRRGCTVILLDPPHWQGRATPHDIDTAALGLLRSSAGEIWPRHTALVQRWSATGFATTRSTKAEAAALHVSDKFTDLRRLTDLPLGRASHIVVMRPGALLLPATTLQQLFEQARLHDLDCAVLAGVPSELCYVVSTRTLSLLASVSDVPGTVTVPHAVERLSGAGPGAGTAGGSPTVTRVTAADSSWLPRAGAVAPSTWRLVPAAALLALPSGERLAARIAHDQASFADAHAKLARHRPDARTGDAAAPTPRVLVVVPSEFQTGAHAAWTELASELSPALVAFVVGRGTVLARVLRDCGFTVHEVADGLRPGSAPDAAVLLEAFEALGPAVVHLDGAEGNTWAGMLHARGARIVVHVRLNDAERFRPSFLFADAVVGVSERLCADIALRVGTAVRVAHIPDGVRVTSSGDESAPTPPLEGAEVLCLCIGRVEPAKDQHRVLAIFAALRAQIPCRLLLVGPCGSDAAYCDDIRRRVAASDGVQWRPFSFPLSDLYRQAHVVIVGSRNEALGMVGLETLAAGRLLVAQRSTGYERIIDPTRREGLLFERDEAPEAVARRMVAALADFDAYSTGARRKAAECFDARSCADRLAGLWQELAHPQACEHCRAGAGGG